jgi:3-oxoacyl-(acyl-carrier-protein) synthase
LATAAHNAIHVVGRGAVSCFGAGHDALIDSIFAGDTGIRPLERLAGTDCLTKVAAEVPRAICAGVDRDEDLPRRFATLAAREALEDWGGQTDGQTLFVLASTKADMSGIITESGDGLGSPGRLAHTLAADLGLTGPVTAVSCACASGLSALAFAGRELRAGTATRALVVGADSITPFILRGFSSLLALDPERCRPFDRTRRGLNLGEGAGAIVLSTQTLDNTDRETHVSLAGWGESNDANHITGPSRDGRGLALAIERALRCADTPPCDIDYAHLHGTATVFNDAMESRALARVFEVTPPASGSKAQIGHTLGAAGILEGLIAIAALRRRLAPPNVGFASADEDSPIELSATEVPLLRGRIALKSAAGFGGINTALVFRESRSR